nr:hypothetical protein [Tanacetum cinerariifolium]
MVRYTVYRVVKLLVKFATTHIRTSSNPKTHANIHDGRVVVQIIQVRQAQSYSSNVGKGKGTGNTRVGKGIMPNSVQQRRGLRILNGFDSDYEELQLNTTSILMTEKVDAYDLEVNDALTASAIFMTKLSPASSINRDEVSPSYDSDILSELPNSSTHHTNDMFNPFVQEFPASEQLVFVNDTYVDFLSDTNVISDNPYPDDNK